MHTNLDLTLLGLSSYYIVIRKQQLSAASGLLSQPIKEKKVPNSPLTFKAVSHSKLLLDVQHFPSSIHPWQMRASLLYLRFYLRKNFLGFKNRYVGRLLHIYVIVPLTSPLNIHWRDLKSSLTNWDANLINCKNLSRNFELYRITSLYQCTLIFNQSLTE